AHEAIEDGEAAEEQQEVVARAPESRALRDPAEEEQGGRAERRHERIGLRRNGSLLDERLQIAESLVPVARDPELEAGGEEDDAKGDERPVDRATCARPRGRVARDRR